MLNLLVDGYEHQKDALVGNLFINGVKECFTLEDWEPGPEHRVDRGGPWPVVLRKEGHIHELYSEKFPDFHQGMIQFLVPGRRWIEFHIGNSSEDTMGCLLPGMWNLQKGKISNSTGAYVKAYKKIIPYLLKNEPVFITYATIPANIPTFQ